MTQSMLASVQRILVLTTLTFAVLALVIFWHISVIVALVVGLIPLFLYVGLLALQFIVLARVNSHDPAPAATRVQLFRAWLLESWVAACVFFWWQPFRAAAIPDRTAPATGSNPGRGIVFIHGFVCNRGLWTRWMRALASRDVAYIAVNLEPIFASIDDYAPLVDKAVQQITRSTGMPPLLVCHSMGGLAARAWLRQSGGDARVFRVVTIGSPHCGTTVGGHHPRLPLVVNGEQMRYGSEWINALAREESAERSALFICFYSNCDNIVTPSSSATLAGADNRFRPGVAHVALALDKTVMDQTLAML